MWARADRLLLTDTWKTASSENPEPNPTSASKLATAHPKRKAATSVKTVPDKSTTNKLVVTAHRTTSQLDNNSKSPPSPPNPDFCGGDSSAAHVYIFPLHKGIPLVDSPEDRYLFVAEYVSTS